MPADLAATLPTLTPVLVAGEGEVDELVRTARAGVAILALRLRTAEQEADLAAHEGQVWDLVAARDLLNASVGQRMATRRVEMAEELERARSDAARLVLSTRTEAADLIAKASEETLAILLAGASQLEAAVPPNLRVVTEPPASPVAEPMPFVAPFPVAEPASSPDTVSDPLPSAVADAVRAAVAAAVRDVVAERAPAPVAEPLPLVAMVAAAEPASQPTIVGPAATGAGTSKGRSGISRFLYLDVLLPMIAVLVVLIVLLAWVG